MSIETCYHGEHCYENISKWKIPNTDDEALVMWCNECGSVIIDLRRKNGEIEPGEVMDIKQPDLLVYSYERDKALHESIEGTDNIMGMI